MENQTNKGIFYPLAAYLLWGLLTIYWKQLSIIPAWDILAHRIFWSFLFLAAILTFNHRWGEFKVAFSSKRSIITIAAAAILISINWLVFIWAVNNNHIVESSMGYYINPLLTILLGTVVLKEKRDRWQTLSIVLAFTGVAYFTYQFGSLPWVAITLAVSFALYGLVKKMSPLNSLVGLTAETIMVAPFAVLYLIYQGSTSTTYESISISTIVLILLSGLVTSIPLLLFAKGAKRVSLTTLGFVQYITPTISLLIGVFVYGETFTLAHRICFVLIWISLLIYSTTRKKRG